MSKDKAIAPDPLSLYLKNIGNIPLLSAQEEQVLAKTMSNGDASARKKMIESNLRLVVYVAKRYQNRGLDLDDLISAGNIELITTVEKFKVNMKCKFSTYAFYWILQAVTREIENCADIIRIPNNIRTDLHKLNKVIKEHGSKKEQ